MTAMTCGTFEGILPDYLEGDLGDEAKAAADAHAKTCESCAKLIADIDRITSEAASLPAMHPARDLWSGIEQRISARVIPLAQPDHRKVRRFISARMAAAAAALIVTTAGITYLATSRMAPSEAPQVVAAASKVVVPNVDSSVTPSDVIPADRSQSTGASAPGTPTAVAKMPVMRERSRALASNDAPAHSPRMTSAATESLSPNQAEAAYSREIETLERMVNSPKSGLDPATVQIVKKNLDVIDDAIARSKAALAKDPASSLLYDQVTRAMSKKVELLRTMAALSSST